METAYLQIMVSGTIGTLFGGVAGTLLKTALDIRKEKMQPVAYEVEPVPMFNPQASDNTLSPRLTWQDEKSGQRHELPNVLILKVTVINTGNKDLTTFKFGLNTDRDNIVLVKGEGADRHHVANVDSPTPSTPRKTVDFECTPFNRQDKYTFSVFVSSRMLEDPEFAEMFLESYYSEWSRPIQVTTAMPVRLVRITPLSKRLDPFSNPLNTVLVICGAGIVLSGSLTVVLSLLTLAVKLVSTP